MKNSGKIRDTYNKIASDYHQDHLEDTWDDKYINLFIKLLPKGAEVLDLGCGPGTDSAKLAKGGLKVDGFDLSDNMLKIARAKNPSVNFIQGDMRSLPYANSSFDGLFAKASLLHIPKKNIHTVFEEIKRVVKPNGIIHIAVKAGKGESDITEKDYGYKYTRFFSYWSMDELIKILTKYCFQITHQEGDSRTGKIWLKVIAKKV
ncbi:MAG: class I SAM-dependent methyltransferase [bacterium]|nr:class I SAM-dependent methyltransferase [bacterium]